VAIPIRRPVNDPGPTPTAIRSIASQPPAASTLRSTSASRMREWRGRPSGPGPTEASLMTSPSLVTATATSAVALSMPSTLTGVHSSRLNPARRAAALVAGLGIGALALLPGCGTGNQQALKALDQGQKKIEQGLSRIEKTPGTPKEAKKLIDKARRQSRRQIEQGRQRVHDQSPLGQ
jgi:hypothetical protein